MGTTKMLTSKGFYILTALCSLIILFSSLEAAFKIKDSVLFEEWVRSAYPGGDPNKDVFSIYGSAILTAYMFRLLSPTVIAITAFMVLNRHGQLGIMAYIWIVMSIGGLAYNVVDADLDSFFYYIGIVLYFILISSVYALALKRNYNAAEGGE